MKVLVPHLRDATIPKLFSYLVEESKDDCEKNVLICAEYLKKKSAPNGELSYKFVQKAALPSFTEVVTFFRDIDLFTVPITEFAKQLAFREEVLLRHLTPYDLVASKINVSPKINRIKTWSNQVCFTDVFLRLTIISYADG